MSIRTLAIISLAFMSFTGCAQQQENAASDLSWLKSANADWNNVPLVSKKFGDLNYYIVETPQGDVYNAFAGAVAPTSIQDYVASRRPELVVKNVTGAEFIQKAGVFSDLESELTDQIRNVVKEAVDLSSVQVCDLKALPEKVTIDAEVRFDLVAGGSIKLTLEYNVDEMCKRVT